MSVGTLTFEQSVNHVEYSMHKPDKLLDVYRRSALVRAIMPGDNHYGYHQSLYEVQGETIEKLLQQSHPTPLKASIKALKSSAFNRLFFLSKEINRFISQQQSINRAVQNVLHSRYQTRDIRSQLSELEVGLYYLINAFSDYLTSDLNAIRETYSGEAKDFAGRINQYYMHFDLNTKTSLAGKQVKACVDSSLQLHKLLKK